MIISHKHKFIFLHCRKVAGSSITTLLNRYLGSDDIQTGAWPDTIEAGGSYNTWALQIVQRSPWTLLRGSAGYAVRSKRLQYNPWVVNRLVQSYLETERNLPGGAHPLAERVRAFDPKAWRDYYKFCFVRNPWDYALSDFYWRSHMRGVSAISFVEYLKRVEDPERPDPERLAPPHSSNWPIYSIDDKVSVDFVGRYETLEEDLRSVGKTLGLTLELQSVPRAKGRIRSHKKTMEEMYNGDAMALVSLIYRREISEFCYKPPF